ncbi:hypothetical protein D3C71_2136910 [compost metagenome]
MAAGLTRILAGDDAAHRLRRLCHAGQRIHFCQQPDHRSLAAITEACDEGRRHAGDIGLDMEARLLQFLL